MHIANYYQDPNHSGKTHQVSLGLSDHTLLTVRGQVKKLEKKLEKQSATTPESDFESELRESLTRKKIDKQFWF